MAFPDYSMVIVESHNTQGGAVSRQVFLFTDASNARTAYFAEVASSNQDVQKRVFLYEQPTPTKFKRDDAVPVPNHLDTWD